jgi:hypothetical protein
MALTGVWGVLFVLCAHPEKAQMKSAIALAVFVLSLSAMAQTTVSTQQVNLPLFIPCVNHG